MIVELVGATRDSWKINRIVSENNKQSASTMTVTMIKFLPDLQTSAEIDGS